MDPFLNATRYVVFGSISNEGAGPMDYNVTTFNCSVSSIHVESSIDCISNLCNVTKIRRSIQDKRSSLVSPLDNTVMCREIFQGLPCTGGSLGQVQSSPVEIFLNDTTIAPYSTGGFEGGFVDLSLVAPSAISARLSIILNTYYQIYANPIAFLGDRSTNLSLYGPDTSPINTINTWFGTNATLDNVLQAIETSQDEMPLSEERTAELNNAPFVAATANATTTENYQIFVCNFGWLAVLLITSTILIFLGTSSALFKLKVIVPDMLGYVSSMTYNNSILKELPRGLPLDAVERGRRLGKLQVRIGDINGEEEVGLIAFTQKAQSVTLRKGRTYIS